MPLEALAARKQEAPTGQQYDCDPKKPQQMPGVPAVGWRTDISRGVSHRRTRRAGGGRGNSPDAVKRELLPPGGGEARREGLLQHL